MLRPVTGAAFYLVSNAQTWRPARGADYVFVMTKL